MNKTKSALLTTIHQLCRQRSSHYCTPSPAALLSLLDRHHSIKIRQRWLCQCLHDLEDLGMITRRFRFRRSETRSLYQLPSLVSITLKGARFLFKRCVTGARDLMTKISAWAKGDDKRFPAAAAPRLCFDPLRIPAASSVFSALLSSLGAVDANASP